MRSADRSPLSWLASTPMSCPPSRWSSTRTSSPIAKASPALGGVPAKPPSGTSTSGRSKSAHDERTREATGHRLRAIGGVEPRPSWAARTLTALSHPDYQRFAVALLLTSIGAQILLVATLWQVYVLTGSALLLGLTGLARAIPQISLSLVGGVIADRVNRARMLQFAQAINAVLILGLCVLTLTGVVELWHIYAVTFLNGATTALTQPARTAVIPSLVPRHHLMNAIAFNSTVIQTSMIVGPALGG